MVIRVNWCLLHVWETKMNGLNYVCIDRSEKKKKIKSNIECWDEKCGFIIF